MTETALNRIQSLSYRTAKLETALSRLVDAFDNGPTKEILKAMALAKLVLLETGKGAEE